MQASERGVVICPGKINFGGDFKDGFFAHQRLPEDKWTRAACLFFDHFDLPHPVGALNGPDPLPDALARLQEAGYVRRTPFPSGTIDGSRYEALRVFDAHEEEDPGQWAVADPLGDSTGVLDGAGRSQIVTLYNALPVPSEGVPFEKVLEFREQRKDEQQQLRAHIEELYQAIASAGDGPLMLRSQITRLEKASRDSLMALDETGWRLSFAGIEARFKWEFDLTTSLITAGATAIASGGIMLAALGAGVAANLVPKIEVSTGGGVARARQLNSGRPFEYLIKLEEEL